MFRPSLHPEAVHFTLSLTRVFSFSRQVICHAASGFHCSSSDGGVRSNGRRWALCSVNVFFLGRAVEDRRGFRSKKTAPARKTKKSSKKEFVFIKYSVFGFLSGFFTIEFLINIFRFFNKYSFFFRKVGFQLGTVAASGRVRRRGRARGDKGSDMFVRNPGWTAHK